MAEARILIVEDEGIEALDLQHRLTSLGYAAPDIVATGEEAVIKAEETRPDLILMDIMLRGAMDGVTAAGRIHARFDIPVIFITAYADEDTLRRAKTTEPYGYLVKPFKEKDLHISIDMALYKHTMEKKVKESEKWLGTTLRSIGDAVIATDKTGLITFMNPVAEELMGWKLDEVKKKNLMEVFHILNKDTRKPAENPVTRVLLEGNIVGLANHTVLISRNGKEIPINDSAAPIKDDHGNILGVILVFSDMTEREKAEEALREAYERKHAQEALRKANEILELRVAERTAELRAANASLRDSRRATLNMMEDALAARKRIEEANAELQCEVEERKKAEADVLKLSEDMATRNLELESVNRELEAFIYSVSHDLRAPLRSVSGFSKAVVEDYSDKLDAQGRDYLVRIHDGSVKMTRLINDLLHLSKISRQEIAHGRVDLSGVVSALVAELRKIDPERGIEVEIKEGLTALADHGLMKIVLANLVGNAWKFTSKTQKARIEFGAVEKEGKTVYFMRDNGAGFDQAYAEKMFWPFQRLHSDREFEGTGIGLAIVERVIRRHGGKVWAEGEPNKGATVYFMLG